jgi:hypothetical protein
VLGARVDRCPHGMLPASVPSWMAKIFLGVWGQGGKPILSWSFPRPLGRVRNDIRELPRAIAERWPSPLQSVCRLSWPINSVSGRAAQVLDYAARAARWGPRRLAGIARG